jgi:hypothetical protein
MLALLAVFAGALLTYLNVGPPCRLNWICNYLGLILMLFQKKFFWTYKKFIQLFYRNNFKKNVSTYFQKRVITLFFWIFQRVRKRKHFFNNHEACNSCCLFIVFSCFIDAIMNAWMHFTYVKCLVKFQLFLHKISWIYRISYLKFHCQIKLF